MTKFQTLLLALVLTLAAGCSTQNNTPKPPPAPGLYLSYYKPFYQGPPSGFDRGVVGPVTASLMPFYYDPANNMQISVQTIRENASYVTVSFLYLGGNVEHYDFYKTRPTRITLLAGIQVTGSYQR